MSEITKLTIAEARSKLKTREFSSLELTNAYLAAIDAANPALNAYVAVTHDKARAMAEASDKRLAAGEGGALEGIPLGVKDLFATEGVHTQAGSHILDGFEPRYESTVTANLWADGAVMLAADAAVQPIRTAPCSTRWRRPCGPAAGWRSAPSPPTSRCAGWSNRTTSTPQEL